MSSTASSERRPEATTEPLFHDLHGVRDVERPVHRLVGTGQDGVKRCSDGAGRVEDQSSMASSPGAGASSKVACFDHARTGTLVSR